MSNKYDVFSVIVMATVILFGTVVTTVSFADGEFGTGLLFAWFVITMLDDPDFWDGRDLQPCNLATLRKSQR